jgi:hypothetical protein
MHKCVFHFFFPSPPTPVPQNGGNAYWLAYGACNHSQLTGLNKQAFSLKGFFKVQLYISGITSRRYAMRRYAVLVLLRAPCNAMQCECE